MLSRMSGLCRVLRRRGEAHRGKYCCEPDGKNGKVHFSIGFRNVLTASRSGHAFIKLPVLQGEE
jgi:hypothetical protein